MSCFIVVFLSTITFLQFALRSGLGLTIEQRQDTPHFGAGMDENPLQFRPVGLSSHANSNAHQLLTYGIFSFLLLQILLKKNQPIFSPIMLVSMFLFCFFAIIFTQSRAVYLSLALIIVVSSFIYRLQAYKKSEFFLNTIRNSVVYKMLFYAFIFVVLVILFDRSLYSFYSFHPRAGFQIRDKLYEEAMAMWWQDFYFGVGNGMFIPALYSFNPTGIVSYFPESVHNGFMLFITERGLWASLLVVIFVYVFSKRYSNGWQRNKQNYFYFLLPFLYFSSLIIMFFHPFVSFFSPVLLIVILYDVIENHDAK